MFSIPNGVMTPKRFISLLSIFSLLTLSSCVTTPEGGYTSAPTDRTYSANYDRVWGALVSDLSAKAAIKNVDKASGLLTTEEFSLGSGILVQNTLQKYAYQPPNLLGTWSDSRASVSVYVSKQGKGTNVRVTARIAGFENNVSHAWMSWPTKGVLEQEVLNSISRNLGTPSS